MFPDGISVDIHIIVSPSILPTQINIETKIFSCRLFSTLLNAFDVIYVVALFLSIIDQT